MSKKHFEAIASILAGEMAISSAPERHRVWVITLAMADYFARENERFDRESFYGAVFGPTFNTSDHFEVSGRIQADIDLWKSILETGFIQDNFVDMAE
jgi:hypothetical protein